MHDHDQESTSHYFHQIMATSHIGLFNRLLERALQQPGVNSAVQKATASGVSWPQILAAIVPMVLAVLGGGQIDFQAVITAILALIKK